MLHPSIRRCLFGASLAWAACTSPVEREGSTLPGLCQADEPLLGPQKTDILFVIDNSNSMSEEQAAIASELPSFIDELKRGNGLVQDFRVGVITSSVYQRAELPGGEQTIDYPLQSGRLQPVPNADGSPSEQRFLEDEDPELIPKFRRLVAQGTFGSGQEAPFEAVRLAITDLAKQPIAEGGNREFFRQGSRLLVVVVTDEDDCSSTQRPPPVALTTDTSRDLCTEQSDRLTSVDEYFRLFNRMPDGRGSSREVIWAAIAPVALSDKRAESTQDVTPSGTYVRNVDCPTSYGPGFRQREMASRFRPDLANLDSICKPSYRQSLVDIALLANTSQSLEVMSVPDARLLQVRLTRADDTTVVCSTLNNGLRYEPAEGGNPARVFFEGECVRRPDDRFLSVRLLCAT